LLDYEKYRNTLKTDYLHLLNVETFSCKDATWLSSSRPDKNWEFWVDCGGIVKLRELYVLVVIQCFPIVKYSEVIVEYEFEMMDYV